MPHAKTDAGGPRVMHRKASSHPKHWDEIVASITERADFPHAPSSFVLGEPSSFVTTEDRDQSSEVSCVVQTHATKVFPE